MICPRRDVANFKVPQTGAATAVLLIKQWRQCSKPQASNWIKQNEVWLYLTTTLEYITVKSACIYWQTPSFEPNRMLSVKTVTAVSYGATQSTGHDCRLRHITHVINRDLNAESCWRAWPFTAVSTEQFTAERWRQRALVARFRDNSDHVIQARGVSITISTTEAKHAVTH